MENFEVKSEHDMNFSDRYYCLQEYYNISAPERKEEIRNHILKMLREARHDAMKVRDNLTALRLTAEIKKWSVPVLTDVVK